MAWPVNIADGDIIVASHINAIKASVATWGGGVDANGQNLVNTGFVGIGTSNPLVKLHTSADALTSGAGGYSLASRWDTAGGDAYMVMWTSRFTAGSTGASAAWLLERGDASGFQTQIVFNPTTLTFGFNRVTHLVLTSAGQLGIGGSPSYSLHLAADSAAKPGTNTWTVASDARIKRDVRPYERGLETLLRLRPVAFEYNGEGGMPEGLRAVGLTAQDVAAVLPDCVSSYAGEIGGERTDVMALNMNELAYLMLNAIRDLAAKIDGVR